MLFCIRAVLHVFTSRIIIRYEVSELLNTAVPLLAIKNVFDCDVFS